nr:ribosomal protein L32 [Cyanidium sp. THAL103]
MAVPKKKTSKSKTRSRRSNWIGKARFSFVKAQSLVSSILKRNSSTYILNQNLQDF